MKGHRADVEETVSKPGTAGSLNAESQAAGDDE